MGKSQVILGIILMVIGAALELIPIIGWIYGTFLFLTGLFLIIYRKEEDKIEKIRRTKK
jgi:hypothetical protein